MANLDGDKLKDDHCFEDIGEIVMDEIRECPYNYSLAKRHPEDAAEDCGLKAGLEKAIRALQEQLKTQTEYLTTRLREAEKNLLIWRESCGLEAKGREEAEKERDRLKIILRIIAATRTEEGIKALPELAKHCLENK